MRQMYPIHIPEIKMGWALTQDIMRVTVIFAFNDWYIISGDPDNPGAVQNDPINNGGTGLGTNPNGPNNPGIGGSGTNINGPIPVVEIGTPTVQ